MAWPCQHCASPWHAQPQRGPCSCAALPVPVSDCPHGRWAQGAGAATEITGGRPIVANSPDYRTELPAVQGLGHVTSSAGTQLSAAMQAAADSLCCAWLQHVLPDTSAGTDQEHEWHKSHRSVQAEQTDPEMDKTKGKPSPQSCALGLLLPYNPWRSQSQVSEQRQVTSCDPGCVLHIPQQPGAQLWSQEPQAASTFAHLNTRVFHCCSFGASSGWLY